MSSQIAIQQIQKYLKIIQDKRNDNRSQTVRPWESLSSPSPMEEAWSMAKILRAANAIALS